MAVDKPTVLIEVDLGDTALVVTEHLDGNFTLDVNSERVVMGSGQFNEFLAACVTVAGDRVDAVQAAINARRPVDPAAGI